MSKHIDIVPKWLRIVVGILALLNILFGVMGYFDMSILFKDGTGLDLTNAILKIASFEFAARNLAIGLGLAIVAAKGVPESITIVTIIRALIEIQTIITMMVTGNISAMILMPLVFLVAELFIIKTLIGVIQKRDAAK
ncbi:hypothetical protein CJD36_021400 [Flavipsychrobacter stenotrophus]|uniref:DUF4345 domain-containing protein n=1 Tax=Flavipsychrobacter stenotrophus TaxID=2077091 RepID=A0A2S7SQG2_9BACT|nr:hypothetical protein [Flavipsychrobacter stenotrophus]PQJ08968.1 hypothetical protein CJD36_021400 [Flavipsychrobacter stenotrophus]